MATQAPVFVGLLASFRGGMNRFNDATKLASGEYALLVNGRTRRDLIEPVPGDTLLMDGLPVGNLQGLYASTDYGLAFVDGKAYTKDFRFPNTLWVKVPDFQMSSTAEVIYAELVPGATVLGTRKLTDAEDIYSGIKLTGSNGSSLAAVVCQDGVNPPWKILFDGTASTIQNLDEWSMEAREYVPIGRQMMYYGSTLYLVSADGRLIYRSVSGRPLDFVIAVNTDGNKFPGNESDAIQTAWRVDYDEITAIRSLCAFDGSFYVSTNRASYLVTPVTDGTKPMIYGEPNVRIVYLFNVGARNQFSVVDILGDTALIDYSGIRTFNAVLQIRYEGRNAPFSAKVNDLLDGIVQSTTCSCEFDNYIFFAVTTKFGPAMLVYDTLSQVFVSMDLVSKAVKFMTVIKTALSRTMLIGTVDNRVYEYGTADTYKEVMFYSGEFCSGNPTAELHPTRLRLVFVNATADGTVAVSAYSDRVEGLTFQASIKDTSTSSTVVPPFGLVTADDAKVLSFDLTLANQAWKHGFFIKWNFAALLSHLCFEASYAVRQNNLEQTANDTAAISAGLPSCSSIVPLVAEPSKVIHVYGTNLRNVLAIKIGTTVLSGFELHSDNELTFVCPVSGGYVYLLSAHDELKTEQLTVS